MKTIGFFGGDSQVGTTMIAQSVAESLQGQGNKVLFIMGSGKSGSDFLPIDETNSIDDLRVAILSGTIDFKDLTQAMVEVRGLCVIGPVRNSLTARSFPENTFEAILAAVEDQFDFIIIDGGDNGNMGLTVSALMAADQRYCITTQQSKSVHRMENFKKFVLDILNLEGQLLINKYMKDPALLLRKDIETLSRMTGALTIPYIEYGWQAEMEQRSLMDHKGYAKGILAIRDTIEGIDRSGARSSERKGRLWKRNFV